MSDHLPECPAPLCDWGYSNAECMGYEDCHHLCVCDALRACEQRVRMEDDDYAYVSAQAEADGRWRGWVEALDAARETVTDAGICTCTGSAWHGHDGSDDRCPVPIVLAAIDALRSDK